MAKRDGKRPTAKDLHLWHEVTRSVKPLHPRSKQDLPQPPKMSSARAALDAARGERDDAPRAHGFESNRPKPAMGPARTSSTHKPLEPRMRRRLMRGQLPIDATIDLHGMRQVEAHDALTRFIIARYARGDRTLLVITGKGLKKTGFGQIEQQGVLRHMLPVWLNSSALAPLVAGWQVSAQVHGGEGAYYVRLKRAAS